ncbi:MAG: hypothetical protein ACJASQ_001252 [Crocinitomicaceae bacterium]|jgi:hypothetical protein
MKKLQLSEEELKWFKDQLQYGDIKRIATMSNYSVHTVYLFFKGSNNHTEILESLIKLIDNRQKSIGNILEFVKKHGGNS